LLPVYSESENLSFETAGASEREVESKMWTGIRAFVPQGLKDSALGFNPGAIKKRTAALPACPAKPLGVSDDEAK